MIDKPCSRLKAYGGQLYRKPYPSAQCVDRKSTRLNSSHSQISYAVFCLKKKKIRHHRSPAAAFRALHTEQLASPTRATPCAHARTHHMPAQLPSLHSHRILPPLQATCTL